MRGKLNSRKHTSIIANSKPTIRGNLTPSRKRYRISGHESFPCRYAWLPKVARLLAQSPQSYSDDEKCMVELGLGKNMVRSARFWAHAAGIICAKGTETKLTEIGKLLLGPRGLDPFLEDVHTLWLIHWKLCTEIEYPLLAWDFLFNRWQDPDFTPSAGLKAIQKEAVFHEDRISNTTLGQHLDVFIHTYITTRGRKGEVQEDNLDCPLVELDLITKVGERDIDKAYGKKEPIFRFRREEKPEVSLDFFCYCLNDFWIKRHAQEETLPLREIAHGYGSPGQLLKLPEEDVRDRIEALSRHTKNYFTFVESVNLQQVRRNGIKSEIEFLSRVYEGEKIHV